MSISREDIQDWEVNPVTKAVLKKLGEAGLESLGQISIQETCDQTGMRTADNIGYSKGGAAWQDAVDELKGDSE